MSSLMFDVRYTNQERGLSDTRENLSTPNGYRCPSNECAIQTTLACINPLYGYSSSLRHQVEIQISVIIVIVRDAGPSWTTHLRAKGTLSRPVGSTKCPRTFSASMAYCARSSAVTPVHPIPAVPPPAPLLPPVSPPRPSPLLPLLLRDDILPSAVHLRRHFSRKRRFTDVASSFMPLNLVPSRAAGPEVRESTSAFFTLINENRRAMHEGTEP